MSLIVPFCFSLKGLTKCQIRIYANDVVVYIALPSLK